MAKTAKPVPTRDAELMDWQGEIKGMLLQQGAPKGAELDDLVGEVLLGMVRRQMVEKFDPERGSWTTFLWNVCGSYLRNQWRSMKVRALDLSVPLYGPDSEEHAGGIPEEAVFRLTVSDALNTDRIVSSRMTAERILEVSNAETVRFKSIESGEFEEVRLGQIVERLLEGDLKSEIARSLRCHPQVISRATSRLREIAKTVLDGGTPEALAC